MRKAEQSWIPGQKIETVVQGDFRVASDQHVVLSTVLGSCVAVCLYDETARIGGMNHYLLAVNRQKGSNELKYGAMAMELLINELLKAGAVRSRLRAKLFGGARITAGYGNIGEENARFGRDFLLREGFEIVSADLGGERARRVHFHPASGRARMMAVPNHPAETLPRPTPVPERPSTADITLF